MQDKEGEVDEWQYYVKWKGYGPEYNCWVPEKDMLDKAMIAEFVASYGGKPPAKEPKTPGTKKSRKGVRVQAPPSATVDGEYEFEKIVEHREAADVSGQEAGNPFLRNRTCHPCVASTAAL